MFILIFILALMVLVITHEFGHFIMAKKFKVKVLEFGFGLPPKIISKRFGQTKYSLNLLPIGGFVKLLGEDEVDKKVLADPHSFASQKVLRRITIVGAGVVMNLLLAWLLFYLVLILQNFRIIYPTTQVVVVVADVNPYGAASNSGVKVGDRILSLDGNKLQSLEEIIVYIKSHPGQKINLGIGDIDGRPQRQISVVPKKQSNGEGLIGVAFSPVPFKQYSTFIQKLSSGITYSWDLTRLTFGGLFKIMGDVLNGNLKEASQNVVGPIGLVKVSQNISSLGAEALPPYLWFLGVISLSLAIFNFLPIPALDGGRLAFLFYEGVTGKKPNAAFEKIVHNVGMALLLTLIALITVSDIRKLL